MKNKLALLTIFIFGFLTLSAQTKFYVYQTNGTAVEFRIADVDSITFSPIASVEIPTIDITNFFGAETLPLTLGANIEGTYTAPAEASSVMLVGCETEDFTPGTTVEIPVSGGTFSIPKTGLPTSTIIYAKIVATVGTMKFGSDAMSVHTAELFQVHNFMSTDYMRTTNAAYMTFDVDNGVWALGYAGGQSWNGYGVIDLPNILDNASKSITDIKGVFYRQKSTGDINQTVTYVRENANFQNFNVNSVVGAGSEDIWSEVFKALDCSNLVNTNEGRRLSIGVHTVPNPAGTLYVKDLYFLF